MTRMRLLTALRRKDYFRPLIRTLAEFGITEYEIEPPRGRGHPVLRFSAAGGEHRIPLPGTPNGGSHAKHYLRNEIRRRIAPDMAG